MLASDPTENIESEVSSALEAQSQYETLEQGAQGDQVEALQQRLAQLGYLAEKYDGHFGATTADCVSRFQTANGIEATGIADPATQAALFAEGALREDTAPLCQRKPLLGKTVLPLRLAEPLPRLRLRKALQRQAPARKALRKAPQRRKFSLKPRHIRGAASRPRFFYLTARNMCLYRGRSPRV